MVIVSGIEVIGITLIAAVIAAASQYVLKRAVPKFSMKPREIFGLIKNRMLVYGVLLYILSLPVYLFALRYGNLSFVYPTFASTFIFVFVISKFMLNEKSSGLRVIGLFFIILGVVLVALTY